MPKCRGNYPRTAEPRYPCSATAYGDEREEEPEVTMIAALDLSDHMLIAADSRAVSMVAGSEDNEAVKLWQLGDMPIVWGVFNNARVGMNLKAWLAEHGKEVPTDSWLDFRDRISREVERLNKETRSEAQKEFDRGQHGTFYFRDASFLFAGYIGGVKNVLTVYSGGTSSFASHSPQVLASEFGPTALNAAIAAFKHERQDKFVLDRETFVVAFEAAGSGIDGVGGDTQLWKLTPDRAEKLQ